MRKSYIGVGVLSIVVGLLMLFAPDAWTKVVVIILGAAAIVNGIFNLFYVRKIISDSNYRKAVILRGVISVLVGLVAVILPLALAATVWTVMLYILGAYLLVSSILEIYATVKLRSSGINAKPYYGEIVISVIMAVILFIIPAQLGMALVRVLGVLLLLAGIAVLVWEVRNRKYVVVPTTVEDVD